MWSSSTSLSDTPEESSGEEAKIAEDYPRQPPPYEILKQNIYLEPVPLSKASKKAKKMVCECVYDPEVDEDGCGEDCLNRLLMIECNPKRCACGEFCTNQRFQKGQYPKLEVFDAGRKGFGLQVLEDVPSGSFIIEYLGEVCSDKEFKRRTKMYAKARLRHHYFMKLKGNEIIDATKKGNNSRFINHSCDPSCETQKWTVAGFLRVGFFSIKPMKAGDEVTFDYKFQRYGRHAQKCFCGSANCRGIIGAPPKETTGQPVIKETEPRSTAPLKPLEAKEPVKRRKRRRRKCKPIPVQEISQETESDAEAEVGVPPSEQPSEENSEEDLTSFQKDLQEILGTEKFLTKGTVVGFLRLTFSAETLDEQITLLSILQATEEAYCLQQFLKRRGLKLMHDWLKDMSGIPFKFKQEFLRTLDHLPISVKNTVTESHILPVVEEWADSLIGEIPEITMTFGESGQQEKPDTLGDVEIKAKATSPSDSQTTESEMPSSTTQLSPFQEGRLLDALNQEAESHMSLVGDKDRQVCATIDLHSDQKKDEDKQGTREDEDSDATIDMNMSNDEVDVDNTNKQSKQPESEDKAKESILNSKNLFNSMPNPDSDTLTDTTSTIAALDHDPQSSKATMDHVAPELSNEAEASGLKETDAATAEELDKQAVYVLASKLLTKWNQLEEKYRIPKKMAKPVDVTQRRHTADSDNSPRDKSSPSLSHYSDEEQQERLHEQLQPQQQQHKRRRRSRFHSYDSTYEHDDAGHYRRHWRTGSQDGSHQSHHSQKQFQSHAYKRNQSYYAEGNKRRRGIKRHYHSNQGGMIDKRKYRQQQYNTSSQYSTDYMEGVTQENTEMILNEYQNENMYGSSEYFQQQEELQPEQHMQAQQQYIPQQPLMQQEQPEQHLGQIQNLPKQGQPMQQQFTDSVYSLSNLQVQSVPSGQQSDISFQSSQFGPSTGLQTQLMTMPVRQPLLPPPGPFQIQNIPPMPSDNMPAGNVQTPQSAVTFVPPPQQTSLQMAPQVRGMHMMSQNHLPVVPPLGGFMNNPFSVPPPMPVKSQSVSASVVGEVPNTVQRIRSGSNSPGEKSQSPPPPPLPPHWRAAKDAEGRTYYYHSKDRISQWEFPTEACARKETSDSLSEKNKKDEMKRDDKTATGPAATPVTSYEVTSTSDAQAGEKYDIKPDISLETWKMAQTELSTAAKKKELIQSEKDPVSKAKEAFRTKVSQVVVQCLNQHYRPDCSQSRIETADDFKHLARKLTYGIMEKHTRNSKHGVLPEFTGGTKSKVQEYVKTYMKKYGEVYTRN